MTFTIPIKIVIPGQARTPQTGQIALRGRLIPGKLYRNYKTAALWFIKCAKLPSNLKLPLCGMVRVTPVWYHKDRRNRDEDNLKKGLGDILKASPLIVDDKQIRWGECGHFLDKENPRTEITIAVLP